MRLLPKVLLTLISVAVCGLMTSVSRSENIVQEWSGVNTPPPPELKSVTVDPRTTALLMLDFMNQSCGQRPRCVASLPAVQKFLAEARSKGATVVHSIVNDNRRHSERGRRCTKRSLGSVGGSTSS